MTLVACVALAGCSSDPCDHQAPDCIAVTVESSLGVDQLLFSVDQPRAESLGYPATPGGALDFPLRLALTFPDWVQAVDITVDGLSGGRLVGTGHVNVPVPASGYAAAALTVDPSVLSDGGQIPDLLAPRDLRADLAQPSDLACRENAANCGGCGITCAVPPNALAASCSGGVCGTGACAPGYQDCDSAVANGCEVYTSGDPLNCGRCGHACPSGMNYCVVGVCSSALRLLVAAPEAFPAELDDVKTKLAAITDFSVVDEINLATSTPTVAQLRAYDVVFLFSNNGGGYADAKTFGDNLADYWDGGGRVVVAVFAQSVQAVGGRFGALANGYLLISPAGFSQTSDSLGTIADPTSPLVAGVSSFASSYRNLGGVANGGVVVATWATGEPLIVAGVVKARKRADLNFLPPSSYWTGDGLAIMKNALLYQ